MKNKERWQPTFYKKDKRGRIPGDHMEKIVGYAYEKIISDYSTGLLVDVGCGAVPYYMIYKDLVTDNICIDWGREDGEVSYLDKIVDLNDPIPLDTEIADTVLCTDVIEHIRKPDLLFSEMCRLLKPGGKMILTVPFLYWIHDAPYDYHRYTKHMLKEFCDRNNLNIVYLEAYGGLPEVIFDSVHKGYVFWNFPLRKPFLFFWESIGRFLYRRKFMQRLSKSSRNEFPLGYILVAEK